MPESAFERVQNLYLVQARILTLLANNLADPELRKEVKAAIGEFEKLLKRVDWRYMGGEDVFESMKQFPKEVVERLRKSPPAVSRIDAKPKAKPKIEAKTPVASRSKRKSR